jgi:regulator of sirC expression with transglutaminase-like and TPR domain
MLKMPAYCHPAAYTAFSDALVVVDTTAGLFRAAFAIAMHEQPTADVRAAANFIDELAETVRKRVRSESVDAKLAHLHDVLFDVVGFAGNAKDYYNPANSYLPVVLHTRRGLPITLTLIYKCVAERIQLEVRGINSPGHFIAAVRAAQQSTEKLEGASPWMYVDPFYGGELLKREDVARRIAQTTGMDATNSSQWITPATHRQWLGRMLNNLQAVFAHAGRERDLYAMQELQSLLT